MLLPEGPRIILNAEKENKEQGREKQRAARKRRAVADSLPLVIFE
jgi:hypothetical protein